MHSLVLELTGKKTPTTGLESKFSVYHSCAVGLLFGQAGEHEYTDEVVERADVIALRARVRPSSTTHRRGLGRHHDPLPDGRELHRSSSTPSAASSGR